MTPRLLTLPEQLLILKRADALAAAAVKAHAGAARRKRMGDPVSPGYDVRKAARERLIETLKEL